MKTSFTVEELALIEYEVHYDEEELQKRKYETLEEYLPTVHKNPWIAMSQDTIIRDISHNTIIDYIDTNMETIDFQD